MAKKNVDCDRIEKDIRMEYTILSGFQPMFMGVV